MLVFSTVPLQKLTGTDGQADRQTGKPMSMCWEAAPPKKRHMEYSNSIWVLFSVIWTASYSHVPSFVSRWLGLSLETIVRILMNNTFIVNHLKTSFCVDKSAYDFCM